VLGANDGLVSTASLIVGVAAADSHGLVAGADDDRVDAGRSRRARLARRPPRWSTARSAALRVLIGGALALVISLAIGRLTGSVV
jgi:VIT1/CCC1 family predicted Fe2+/Mn2+ transporter